MEIISKNNIGGAVLLLFVIILSQSRMLDIFIHTTLGRVVLIAVILFLSYVNKILGVVGVLILVIMMNTVSFNMEGFTANKKAEPKKKEGEVKEGEDAKEEDEEVKGEKKATEGFDVIGIENNIKRGKQSNSIPVNRNADLDNDVFAFEPSSIFGSLSPW